MSNTEILPTITWGNLIDKVREETGALVVYPDDLDLSDRVGLRYEPYYAADLIHWACIEYPILITYHKDGRAISIEWNDGFERARKVEGVEIVEHPYSIEAIEWRKQGESAAAAFVEGFGEGLSLQALQKDSPLQSFICKACNSFGMTFHSHCPNCGAELSNG